MDPIAPVDPADPVDSALIDLDDLDDPDLAPALGVVVEAERGALPFSLIHGEALVAAAAWALGEAGVVPVDQSVPWEGLREAAGDDGAPYVLHDALCPMTPPDFIARCVALARRDDVVVVGVRPVTDTVKRIDGGPDGDRLGATVDRTTVVSVCSPVVLPASVVVGLDLVPTLDFAALVSHLTDRAEVRRVEAPSAARRVSSAEEVRVLEALTRPAG